MGKYIILAETGADIPADLQEQYGIEIVPMHVTFKDVTKDDGSFPATEVFSFYKTTGILPKTSGCNPEDFMTVLDKIHAEHPDKHILYLAYSSVTTCSYQSCVIASEERDYITLVDTKHVSAGQCLVVTLTARYLEQHPDAEIPEIVKYVEKIRDEVKMGFFPGDLDYLRAGGRVSNVAYLGAKILSLNPLIELKDGKLMAGKKYRGTLDKVALKFLPEFAEKENLSREILFLIQSMGLKEETKKQLVDEATKLGFKEIRWITTGCVVSTHSGPGAFGVSGISL
ncbi:MAG: DegV family protein [Clostridiales bacterium]|nr:DegV family protein [Candidatus Blautia equi]